MDTWNLGFSASVQQRHTKKATAYATTARHDIVRALYVAPLNKDTGKWKRKVFYNASPTLPDGPVLLCCHGVLINPPQKKLHSDNTTKQCP